MGLIDAGSGKDPGAQYQRRRNIGGADISIARTRDEGSLYRDG
jgi:hypothetical protein